MDSNIGLLCAYRAIDKRLAPDCDTVRQITWSGGSCRVPSSRLTFDKDGPLFWGNARRDV
jgi:hypothetical protein